MRTLTLAALLLSSAVHAEVYKCVVDGKTTYTDRPCAANATPAVLPPVQSLPGSKASDLAGEFDARLAQEKQARDRADAAFVKQHAEKKQRAEAVRKAIIDHEVIQGMTPSEVHSAIGTADETLPDGRWRYRRDGQRLTVRFQDGLVSGISTTREKKK